MNSTVCTSPLQDPTVAWKPSPNCRGTFDIISTCVATLFICAWSAVHVDIPSRELSPFRRILFMFGWLVVGLLAPDYLLYLAVGQWFNALGLIRMAYAFLDPPDPDNGFWARWFYRLVVFRGRGRGYIGHSCVFCDLGPLSYSRSRRRKHAWKFTHGFYATMGGFVIDTSPTPLQGSHTRFTLTPDGLVWLMKHEPDLIPDISERSIRDRSKADSMSKALLVWQVFYFTASCVARRAQSLPLSLFEVTTLSHALCTILTYIAWWRKPLSIGEPTLITGDKANEIAALLLMSSQPRARHLAGTIPICGSPERRFLTIRNWSPRDRAPPLSRDGSWLHWIQPGRSILLGDLTFTIEPRVVRDNVLVRMIVYSGADMPWFNKPPLNSGELLLELTDISRWVLASNAMIRLGTAQDVEDKLPDFHARVYITPNAGLGATEFMFSSLFNLRYQATFTGMAIMTLYGLVHFLGWNGHFLHEVERWLWRISAVVLTYFFFFNIHLRP